MIIEPVLDKPICIKKEEQEIKRKTIHSNRTRSELMFKEPNEKINIKMNIYFMTLIIFLAGIVSGSIVFRMMINDPNIQNLVIEKFALELANDEEVIFQKSFQRNIKLLIVYWIAGISVVGAPLLLILCLYKGFTTAFVISSFLLKFGFVDGNIYIFKNIFLYYIFLILGIILLTASSLKVALNIFKGRKDIRYELIRHSIFTIVGFILFTISTIIEMKIL